MEGGGRWVRCRVDHRKRRPATLDVRCVFVNCSSTRSPFVINSGLNAANIVDGHRQNVKKSKRIQSSNTNLWESLCRFFITVHSFLSFKPSHSPRRSTSLD
jgi:hypothetical protein